MEFFRNSVKKVLNILNVQNVYAHCDIPCGIYDPHLALVAAHTVLRMDMLIQDLSKNAKDNLDYNHKLSRYSDVKEKHAELCKQEVRIIWGDYFKPEHLQKFPEIHELVWNVMKTASKARQSTDINDAKALLESVNKFTEIFWKTKGVDSIRVKAPYPTEAEMVVPKA